MLRIKEAIQRRRMIQEMTDDLVEEGGSSGAAQLVQISAGGFGAKKANEDDLYINFIAELNSKLSKLQQRALRITWKRLSEAPRTSGRGMIAIIEKVFERMIEQVDIMPIFYKCAFVSCIEDKRKGFSADRRTITTIRDHAHLLIDFLGYILASLYDAPPERKPIDIKNIGEVHAKLEPLGFHRSLWVLFGESFAEVMFAQECIRAYPHAASAWSILSIVIANSFDSATRLARRAQAQVLIDESKWNTVAVRK